MIVLFSELGVHVDGYIATAAHTTVVSSNTQEPITGVAADVIAATHFAYEAALRMLRPGVRVSDIYKNMLWTRSSFSL
jgi:methionine aminopeptidase